jgi:hypothetical protein
MPGTPAEQPSILIANNAAELAVISVAGMAIVDARGRLHEYNKDFLGHPRWWVTGSSDHRDIRDYPVQVVRHPTDIERSIVVTVSDLLALLPAVRPPGAEHVTAADILIARAVPRELDEATSDYYAATDRKHFGDRTEPGSKFLDPALSELEDIVRLAIAQRGSLDGDDRVKFYFDSDPDAFRDGNRYLKVATPGTVGVIHSTELSDASLLSVVRTKPGAPVSLVASVTEQPTTDYAVLIIEDVIDTGEARVVTAFPGTVTAPLESLTLEELEGGAITVAAARDILRGEFWANTRLAS